VGEDKRLLIGQEQEEYAWRRLAWALFPLLYQADGVEVLSVFGITNFHRRRRTDVGQAVHGAIWPSER
jgi:hypothetical protein